MSLVSLILRAGWSVGLVDSLVHEIILPRPQPRPKHLDSIVVVLAVALLDFCIEAGDCIIAPTVFIGLIRALYIYVWYCMLFVFRVIGGNMWIFWTP